MEQLLLAAGHCRAADPESADLLIVNTCGFIESAKQESIDTLLQLGEAKRADQKLIATGCLVERYPTELAAELPVIDAFVGARNWSALPSVVSQLEEARAPGNSLQLVELAPAGELDLEIASRHVRGASAYLGLNAYGTSSTICSEARGGRPPASGSTGPPRSQVTGSAATPRSIDTS